jgi:AmmeMemoRadiSam system protein B
MAKDSGKTKIREATVAGIFYPEAGEELEKEVSSLLEAAAGKAAGKQVAGARAILSPHAGLGYSGDLAALAWHAALPRIIERVVILSPHHRAEESLVYLPEAEFFACPLGKVHVDRKEVSELLDCGTIFAMNDIPHFEEHGIELQLPFMKRLYPEAQLVPIIVGKASPPLVKSLASALALVFSESLETTLFVISSDLAAGNEATTLAAESSKLLSLIEGRDWEGILDEKARNSHFACGSACLAAWLASTISLGTELAVLERHDSSSKRQGEQERLVEYGAIAFIEKGGMD